VVDVLAGVVVVVRVVGGGPSVVVVSEPVAPVAGGVVVDEVSVPGSSVVLVEAVLEVVVVGGSAYWLWKDGSYSTATCGAAKSLAGNDFSAPDMNFDQISAGKLPPVTLMP
jgi:hypothetical protein